MDTIKYFTVFILSFIVVGCKDKITIPYKYPLIYKVVIYDEQNIVKSIHIRTYTYFPEEDIGFIHYSGKYKYGDPFSPYYLCQFGEWNDTLDMLAYTGCIVELRLTLRFDSAYSVRESTYYIADTLQNGKNTITFVWPNDTIK